MFRVFFLGFLSASSFLRLLHRSFLFTCIFLVYELFPEICFLVFSVSSLSSYEYNLPLEFLCGSFSLVYSLFCSPAFSHIREL